jgi:hypothetical protein
MNSKDATTKLNLIQKPHVLSSYTLLESKYQDYSKYYTTIEKSLSLAIVNDYSS